MQIEEKKSFKNAEMKGAKKIACSVETKGDIDIAMPRKTLFNAHSNPDSNPLNMQSSSLSLILQVCRIP